jgi:hypothetical protein
MSREYRAKLVGAFFYFWKWRGVTDGWPVWDRGTHTLFSNGAATARSDFRCCKAREEIRFAAASGGGGEGAVTMSGHLASQTPEEAILGFLLFRHLDVLAGIVLITQAAFKFFPATFAWLNKRGSVLSSLGLAVAIDALVLPNGLLAPWVLLGQTPDIPPPLGQIAGYVAFRPFYVLTGIMCFVCVAAFPRRLSGGVLSAVVLLLALLNEVWFRFMFSE